MKTIVLSIACALVFTLSPNDSYAFGANGHRIVARIAQNHLTPKAKLAIMKITKGAPLAKIVTWPDEIRSDSQWDYAKPWHFLSIDDNESFKNLKRSKKGDVLEALPRFEKQLRDKKIVGEKKWQALAFFIHLMGDIHQPLHVGRRGDRGGNSVKLKWFNQNSNLHSVWDSGLIENQYLSFREYASFLDNITSQQIKTWQVASYLEAAKESKQLRSQVYDLGKPKDAKPNLSYQYSYLKIDIINQRLAKAGVRLAGKLNAIFTK